MSELTSYLEDLASEGELDSSGELTIDLARSRLRLFKNQLPDPAMYVLKLVQAMVRAQCVSLRFVQSRKGLELFAEQSSDELLPVDSLRKALLGDPFEMVDSALRDLVYGLGGALALGPGVGFEFRGPNPWTLLPHARLRSRTKGTGYVMLFDRFFKKNLEVELVKKHCAFCPIPVYWDGKLVQLRSSPWSSDRRLLELRSAQSLPPKVIESLHRDFTRAVESKAVAVVISLESEPGAKGGPRKADFPWVEGLNPAAVVVQCSLDDKEVPAWIRQRAQDLGLTLAGNAAQVLQERVGRDLRLLDSHIQKLRLFQGKGAQSVGVAEVEALVPMSVEVQTWRLTAAIGSKDVKAAYTVLDHLLAQGENPGSILSYVNSYMLSLAELKDLKQRLGSLPAIAAAMPKKSEYQIKKNLEDAATWSDQQLRSGFERLMRADFRIKTGSDALLMLQLTLLQLCSRAGR